VPSSSGRHCWCQITTINGASCSSSWIYFSWYGSETQCQHASTEPVPCARFCAYIILHGSYYYHPSNETWRRSLLLAPAITCPLSGVCETNSMYQAIGSNTSCPSGWVLTTAPTLAISGNYSNERGNFHFGTCTAN
jgi:hypothetical protein